MRGNVQKSLVEFCVFEKKIQQKNGEIIAKYCNIFEGVVARNAYIARVCGFEGGKKRTM